MIEVILKLFGGLALIVLSAIVIMALFLRFLNRHPVDAEEQFDYCDACASEPAPLDDVFRKGGAI